MSKVEANEAERKKERVGKVHRSNPGGSIEDAEAEEEHSRLEAASRGGTIVADDDNAS